ncbi:hypothetical protein MTQ01_13605 [Streptomyces sp. XM4193]|nr:hypothetical protein [Streptomyces sp. XM4193]
MTVSLTLFVSASAFVRLFSVPLAVAMCVVAAVIPPVAAISANRWDEDDHWWDEPGPGSGHDRGPGGGRGPDGGSDSGQDGGSGRPDPHGGSAPHGGGPVDRPPTGLLPPEPPPHDPQPPSRHTRPPDTSGRYPPRSQPPGSGPSRNGPYGTPPGPYGAPPPDRGGPPAGNHPPGRPSRQHPSGGWSAEPPSRSAQEPTLDELLWEEELRGYNGERFRRGD